MLAPVLDAAPAAAPDPIPLTRLTPGATARLYSTRLSREEGALLSALGLSDRSLVRICQAGNPWIVQVRATRIGLSDAVAHQILVVPAG